MADTTRRAIIAVLWRDALDNGLSDRDRAACTEAGKLYRQMREKDIHPVVLVGPTPNVINSIWLRARALVTTMHLHDHLASSGEIPEDHLLTPQIDAHPDENGVETARRHQQNRAEKGQSLDIHFIEGEA